MAVKRIYMDYASTTPVDARVRRAMEKFWTKDFGNPGAVSAEGAVAKKLYEECRAAVARTIDAKPDEIIFTSGGTEANNIAIMGAIEARRAAGVKYENMHAVTTDIEHSSVRECFAELARRKVKVEYLHAGEKGIVRADELEKMLKPETVIVSVMYANNEIGTIQPVKNIADVINRHNSPLEEAQGRKVLFHTDASQAPLYLECSKERLGADLATFDAHKIYGPKGIGALFVKRGVKISPIIFGGSQERNLRSGTENTALAAGFAEAMGLAKSRRKKEAERIGSLRDRFFALLEKDFPDSFVNGSKTERLPNNINVYFPKIDAEFAVLKLDAAGVSASSKSACLGTDQSSYVIEALGKSERARSSIRFSLGADTKRSDVDEVVRIMKKVAKNSLYAE